MHDTCLKSRAAISWKRRRHTPVYLASGFLMSRSRSTFEEKGPELSPGVIKPDKEGRRHFDRICFKLYFHVNSYFIQSYIKHFLIPLVIA